MCLSKLFLIVFIIIVNILLVGGVIFMANNLDFECDKRKTECEAVFIGGECTILYNGTSYSDCPFDDEECRISELAPNTTFSCYTPYSNSTDGGLNDCPLTECINEGMMGGLIALSTITFIVIIVSIVFLCCIIC